ncbi:hypothetical protein [Frankia sp. AgKG'84/4]|uniref:hypothetical protein n=1 Tax=Frankia sp. AgKG'84/4 TaxID=573490 RepID=UPI00202A19A4|nr:hypothetical protein [Frankia sp. AgKG'84/4]MCL9793276.1 hypothetical protein [Frankia sp. AgKG'84/4]
MLWRGDSPLPANTPLNERASALVAFGPHRFHADQRIHGDVILTGHTDLGHTDLGDDGLDLTDVPDLYVHLLDATRCRVQIRRRISAGWNTLGDHYGGLVDAYHATCAGPCESRRRLPTARALTRRPSPASPHLHTTRSAHRRHPRTPPLSPKRPFSGKRRAAQRAPKC